MNFVSFSFLVHSYMWGHSCIVTPFGFRNVATLIDDQCYQYQITENIEDPKILYKIIMEIILGHNGNIRLEEIQYIHYKENLKYNCCVKVMTLCIENSNMGWRRRKEKN